MNRLLSIFWWLLLAAMLLFNNEIHRLFVAHPAMLYVAMGTMIVFMLGKAYQRELDKEKRRGSES